MTQPALRLRAFDLTVLGLLFSSLVTLIVPAHWTSLWMDREFTGWVAPLGNRLASGMVLYTDGGHLPMPPLPAVMLMWLGHGHATWLDESWLNSLLQCAMLVVVYFTLTGLARWPTPIFATLAMTPLTFALPKTIAYDALTQFWVASLGGLIVLRTSPAVRRRRACEFALALVTALLFLTKQSTAVGAFLGVGVALLFLEGRVADRTRSAWIAVVTYAAATALFVGALSICLSPIADPGGMWRDVFLAGSEPKGGAGGLVKSLLNYTRDFLPYGTVAGAVLAVAISRTRWRDRTIEFLDAWPPRSNRTDTIRGGLLLSATSLCPLLLWVAQHYDSAFGTMTLARLTHRPAQYGMALLWFSLAAVLLIVTLRVIFRKRPASCHADRFIALTLVFFPPAVFHNLSVDYFRWTYDNNPLQGLVLLFLIECVFAFAWSSHSAEAATPLRIALMKAAAGAAIAVGIQLGCWGVFAAQYQACRACTETWPECAHLRGARLPPSANGMRALVTTVRESASDRRNDTVLLLPNDPDVESWFERPRPNLTSAIVFPDQYRDAYVDTDFARLQQSPPKVIVVGPRNYWRPFQHQWHTNYGCERLIDRVQSELLPQSYLRIASQPILHQGKTDFMDVFVRR